MARVKSIWFDCDGTLYKTDEHSDALRENAIYKAVASGTGRRIEDIAREYPLRLQEFKSNTNTIKSYKFTEEQAREIYNSFDITKYLENDDKLIKTIDDLLEQDISVNIFTNNKRSVLLGIMKKLGLHTDWFSNLMTAEEVAPKPSTEGYKKIIVRSECGPTEIVYVGDRHDAEIVPAQKEGLNTVLVWGNTDEKTFNQNRLTYHFKKKTVYEVTSVIAELNSFGQERSTDR